jgi:hypothetical protein
MSDDDSAALGELLLSQIKQQGCGCVRVSDGQIFVFTRTFLENTLRIATENEDGLCMVHVKRGPEA